MSEVREAAARIARGLAAAAEGDDAGTFWRCASARLRGQPVEWIALPWLYTGSSGIALFLLEAGFVLQDEQYVQLACAALRWSARAAEESNDYSFFTGRLGIAYALLRAFARTGDAALRDAALRLGGGFERFIVEARTDDFLAGTAGAAIGFLHLLAATGEAWTAAAASKLVQRLIARARWTPQGVTWSIEPENIRGLCGLSHGNSGVALALAEAGRALSWPELDPLAADALRYESAWFDRRAGTWPDFRKVGHLSDEEFGAEFGGEPEEFFNRPGLMDAWCHGAPGIGLARLRMLELGGEGWQPDVERALARTRAVEAATAAKTFTLCHGVCGNAFLLLEAARVLRRPALRDEAEASAALAIAAYARDGAFASGWTILRGEDPSLMLGNAGIGMFFLHLLDDAIPSPLLPRVVPPVTVAVAERMTGGEMVRQLMTTLMPRTMQSIDAPLFDRWCERSEALALVDDAARHLPVGRLETAERKLLDAWPSFALTRFQRWRAGTTPAKEPLRLAPYAHIWRDGDDAWLLTMEKTAIAEQPLTPFAEAVLSLLEVPRTVDEVARLIAEQLPARPDAVRGAVEEQIHAAIAARVVVTAVSPGAPPQSDLVQQPV